ncbi:MAG TPA: hypothetical protein VJB61_08045 [Actinomycetota bacterium]
MSELSRLMLKAVRSLPPEEQDALLEAMLEPRLGSWPGPDPAGPGPGSSAGPGLAAAEVVHGPIPAQRAYGPERGFGVTLPPLGPETGGPWQSVPVRLSTDQHERLKQWCQANGFTMAVVLRGLVARFLDDQATRRPRSPDEPPPPPVPGQAGTSPPGSEPDPGQAGTSPPSSGAPDSGG